MTVLDFSSLTDLWLLLQQSKPSNNASFACVTLNCTSVESKDTCMYYICINLVGGMGGTNGT